MPPSQSSRLPDLFEAVAAAAAAGRGPPPVHLWNPPRCGDIDIRIARDGTWSYLGSPIGRPALVRLFASVLRLDPDGYHLVTPAEKLRITVEDAPFLAVGLEQADGALRFATNVGDVVEAGPEHPIRVVAGADGSPRPYLEVRRGLQALIARAVFYELAALGEERAGPQGRRLAVASNGCWFDLGPLEE